jgi:acyl-coenzyme A thioesterase PaaI-like protein
MPKVQGEDVMEKQPNSRMCFVCGIDNPIGLRLAFYTDEQGRCIAHFQPRPEHQGFPGSLHGGIASTLLDEVMGRVLIDGWAVTGRLDLRYRQPVPLDQELTVVAWLTRERRRAYEAAGEVRLPDGTVLVEATGLYFRIPDEVVDQARSELDFWEVIPD